MSSIIFSNSIGMYAGEVSGMKTIKLENARIPYRRAGPRSSTS